MGDVLFLALLLLHRIGQQIAAAIEYWIQSLPIYIAVTGSVKIFAKLNFLFIFFFPRFSHQVAKMIFFFFFFSELG